MTTIASDPELDALRAVIAADLPAYLADLEHLVNIDCGSYTPAGVDEVGALDRAASSRASARASTIGRIPRAATATRSSARSRAAPARRASCSSATWTRCSIPGPRPRARSASRMASPTARASPT